jgi:hypothetical protein
VNPPRGQTLRDLGGDQLAQRLALAGRPRWRQEAGRQVGGGLWGLKFRQAAGLPIGRLGTRQAG